MRRVLIIGAGAQGNVVGWLLARAPDVGRIVLADLDLRRAEETARNLGSDKVLPERADASKVTEMAERMRRGEFDLVVNLAVPELIPQVMRAALEAGRNYLDLSSVRCYEIEGLPIEQLQDADAWRASGRTAMIHAGSAPGLTNVMARMGADELDEVDRIEIKDYSVMTSQEFVATWVPSVFAIDCATPPWIWADGRPQRVPIFSGEEWVDFPPPVNERGKVYLHAHEEPVTIPLFLGKPVRYCEYKIGDPTIDAWKFIVKDLGLMSEEPIEVGAARVRPRDVLLSRLPRTLSPQRLARMASEGRLQSRAVMLCDVSGRRNGHPLRVRLRTESPDLVEANRRVPGASDVSLMTSASAAVFALMVLRGQIARPGVVLPETLGPEERAIFLRGIGEQGVRVHMETSEAGGRTPAGGAPEAGGGSAEEAP
jgi:saccharopine dehydrogenase-like NADP-dependent oxidoreductase